MSVGKETSPQLKTYIHSKQEDEESYTDVFSGIKAGVTIALSFFWIPFVAIYLMLGWRYVVAYAAILVVAAVMVGPLLNVGSILKALVRKKTGSYRPVIQG